MTRDRRPDAAEEPGSRALVPVEAGGAEAIAPLVRPEAPFVAQLLACRDGVEAFRQRRAGAVAAAACYEGPAGVPFGSELRFERFL
jgi:hypothetical protein